LGKLFPVLIFGFLIGSSILRGIFGRTGGALVSGGVLGVVVWFLSQVLLISIGAGVAAVIAALIFGAAGGGWSAGRGGFGGFGGGGFGGGGFGGGGFGGGGGGFGGGGASGRW
jgi:uncharacterized protein